MEGELVGGRRHACSAMREHAQIVVGLVVDVADYIIVRCDWSVGANIPRNSSFTHCLIMLSRVGIRGGKFYVRFVVYAREYPREYLVMTPVLTPVIIPVIIPVITPGIYPRTPPNHH